MRSKIFKFFIVSITIFIFFGLVITVSVIWPMPKLEPPVKYKTVFIKSVNIIDVKSGNILINRDIIIDNNRIVAIDTTGKLAIQIGALQIDGTNKFAMPGLWDMHTHSTQHSEWLHHPLYIANGVTGIRDMSGQLNERDSYFAGSKERLLWNDELNNNKRITPRYVLQSSFQMDGAFSIPEGFPEYFKLQKNEDINALLQFYKNEKVDFIKVYDQIPVASFKKLTEEAPKYGMHVAGHKPIFVSLKEATISGQRSFEHGRIFLYECFPGADSLRRSHNWRKFLSKSKKSMINDFNVELAKELMQLMKEHNAHWCPTIQTLKFEAFAHDTTFLKNPNLKYINYISKKVWWDTDASNNRRRNLSREGKDVSLGFYNAAKEQIKIANEIGVPIMAGTDVSDSYIFAGFSLHYELEDLTKSGLTNLQALQSATIVPAKYANMYQKHGTIEIGKIADLVILEKNPLEDITNTKTINGVVLNGLYYDANKITALKNFTESLSYSFHTNVKVLYSLVASPLIRLQWAD
jgi:hypothetical protein